MTVSTYISNFIQEYAGVNVLTAYGEEKSDKNGLTKLKGREITEFNDGSCEIVEQYQLFVKQKSEEDVKTNDQWLEELLYWIDDYPKVHGLKEIDSAREVVALNVDGVPYAMEEESQEMIYELTVFVKYHRYT